MNHEKINFDDEKIYRSYYGIEEKKIILFFTAYYDNGNYIEKRNYLIISDWKELKISTNMEKRMYGIEQLDIISDIISISRDNDYVKVVASTFKNTVLQLHFLDPNIKHLISNEPILI